MKHEDTVLAVVAGYVDTLGFVALFGLFTAHVTGNFVLLGAALAGSGQGALLKLLAFPAFVLGVLASRAAVRTRRTSEPRAAARTLYLLQALFLCLFLAAGLFAAPIGDPAAPATLLCGLTGAIAMGVQNAHAKLVGRAGVPNTVMTGNVTQAVLDGFDALFLPDVNGGRRAARDRLARTMPALAGFGAGAVAGAEAYVHVSFWALSVPLALIGWLAAGSRVAAGAQERRDVAA